MVPSPAKPHVVSDRLPLWLTSHERLAATVGVLVAVTVVCSDLIFKGRALFFGDLDTMWHGSAETLVRCIATGSWPTWNPYQAYGQPYSRGLSPPPLTTVTLPLSGGRYNTRASRAAIPENEVTDAPDDSGPGCLAHL